MGELMQICHDATKATAGGEGGSEVAGVWCRRSGGRVFRGSRGDGAAGGGRRGDVHSSWEGRGVASGVPAFGSGVSLGR